MANHKSALKRARQSKIKFARNLSTKKTVRTFERKLRQAIAGAKKEEAATLLQKFQSSMGKATQKGLFKAGALSRKISRLSRQVDTIGK